MNIDLHQYARILACPICRSKLAVDGHSFVCRSAGCRLRFAVRDEIPVMLPDEAQPIASDEWSIIMSNATEV